MVVFEDLEDPFSRILRSRLEKLLATYESKIQVSFLNYPLLNIHVSAIQAAAAAAAAQRQGQFFPMRDAIYKVFGDRDDRRGSGMGNTNPESFGTFLGLAKLLRLDNKQFAKDYEDPTILRR